MANEEQLRILKQGTAAWNDWREEHWGITPDLSDAHFLTPDLSEANLLKANLSGADLSEANLSGAKLNGANLREANLSGADLIAADLSGADLGAANLRQANLSEAKLSGANLLGATLYEANLSGADLLAANLRQANLYRASLSGADVLLALFVNAHLEDADLRGSVLGNTIFADLNLSSCKGLESCIHRSRSSVDIQTLQRSGPLPLAFLRGVGLPDKLIDYLPSLLSLSIQLYSCFISYSAKDDDFVRRLYADLQDRGVRCWFAPADMKIGAKILDALDEAIRLRDKLLLVLSETSIASEWVEDEVTKAFAEERRRGGITVLFPIRLDDAVFATNEAWALKLRDNRNIGDFRNWKQHDDYQRALDRLMRDLRIEAA